MAQDFFIDSDKLEADILMVDQLMKLVKARRQLPIIVDYKMPLDQKSIRRLSNKLPDIDLEEMQDKAMYDWMKAMIHDDFVNTTDMAEFH